MLEPRDDFRHALEDLPHARESLFYNLLLPDEGLLVMFYTWVDGQDRAGHLFAVAGDDDERLAFSAVDGVRPAGVTSATGRSRGCAFATPRRCARPSSP